MMKIKNIIPMLAAMVLLGACAEADEQQKAQGGKAVTIQLTASVATETLSPGDATAWSREAWKELTSRRATRGLYETAIANGEKVYVWADKGTAGTYAFLKAWTLTSDGSGGLTGSTKYYPSDGDGLTFRAVHGNFSTAPTEGTAIGTLTHTVETDQSTAGNYEKSDLMYGEGTGSWESAGTVNFIHKLSKIEVNLTPGIGLIPNDVTNVTVKVRNVKPSITINPSTGALGSASGTASTITARHTGNGVFEVVIPPQAAPSGVLTITMGNVTVTVPNTVTTFAENAKYIYNVKCDNKDKHLNPLWYVAENNVKSYNTSTKVVTLETNPAATGSSYCYKWSDAMAYFAKQGTSYDSYWAGDITDGTTGFKYHLPCRKEWFSMLPSESTVFSTGFMPSGGLVSSAQPCIFGYSDDTKTGVDDWSYWSTYTTANVRYAIRYLGTPYCSAWKYALSGSVLIVTAKLIDYLDKNDATLGTKLASYMNNASFWTSVNEDEGALKRQFYAVGYRNNNDNGGTGTADYWPGEWGYCWSATEVSDDLAFSMDFGNGRLLVRNDGKKFGFPIRLFRNEGVDEARAFNPASLNLGDIIYDDGSVTSNNAYNSSKHAIGVVVYKASSAEAACETGVVSSYGTVVGRVLVMSLQEVNGGTQLWFTANSTDHNNTLFPNVNNTLTTAQTDFQGYAKTKQMATKTGECASHTHAAATAAWNYKPTNATSIAYLINSTGWFLPSIGQWMKVYQAMAGAANISTTIPQGNTYCGNGAVVTKLATYINNAGGNTSSLVCVPDYAHDYWSSSEHSATYAERTRWTTGSNLGFSWYHNNKTNSIYVRPFLAY